VLPLAGCGWRCSSSGPSRQRPARSAPGEVKGKRSEIAKALGSGLSNSLPHHDHQVVCGCVDPDLNPYAPEMILPAIGPEITRWGNAQADSREFVPVFLKRTTNAW